MRRSRRAVACFSWVVFAASVGIVSVAVAEETSEGDLGALARDAEEAGLLDYVRVRFKMASDMSIDSDFGAFSADVHGPEARLRVTVPLSEQLGLRFVVSGGSTIFDFDGSSNLFGLGPSSDPFDPLNSVTLRIQAASLFDEDWTLFSDTEKWSLLAEGFWKSRWESGASVSSGTRGGGTLAVGYQLPERLEIALGVQISSKLTGSGVSVSPVFEFGWNITDRWTLRSDGAGAQIEYALRDDLTLFAGGRLESHTYRLDERGGTVDKGKIRLRRIPALLGLRWNAVPHVRVTLGAGAIAWQELRVEDRDGDELSDPTADPAPYILLRFDLRP